MTITASQTFGVARTDATLHWLVLLAAWLTFGAGATMLGLTGDITAIPDPLTRLEDGSISGAEPLKRDDHP